MKQLFLALAIVSLCFACKQAKETDPKKEVAEQPAVAQTPKYPAAVTKVLDAHGGLERWRQQKTLVYTVAKADNPEVHITDLHSRKDKIETKQYDLGFDGKQAWVLNKEGAYKGNPSFYHNLLFYFYAMPFVLADDGIVYGKTDDLVVNGKSYPGIMITYNNGV